MWRSTDNVMMQSNSYTSYDDEPSTDPKNLGSNFEVQTPRGALYRDPFDDRLVLTDGSYSDSEQNVTILLTGDEPGKPGASIVQSPKTDTWYDTLRPNAGFPLPIMSDREYANNTNDIPSNGDNDQFDIPSKGRLTERALGVLTRLSGHPSSVQTPRPFDTVMGRKEWSGSKASMQRPVAANPLVFDSDIVNGIPSPTGSNNADHVDYTLSPRPLTFRVTPEPWDTGDDGYYVDSGT